MPVAKSVRTTPAVTVSQKSSKSKHPGGRPTKYHPTYCQQLIAYMTKGGKRVVKPMSLSHGLQAGGEIVDHPIGHLPALFEGFARKLKVTMSTLQAWQASHAEFSVAWKQAKEIQLSKMVDGLLSGAYPAAPGIFAMKNMHGWRDQTDVKHSGEIKTGPLVYLPAVEEPHGNGHPAPARPVRA